MLCYVCVFRKLRSEICIIDGLQGRQREIVIITAFRGSGAKPESSSKASTQNLTDPRRLNLALTRAQYGLYIVGHFSSGVMDYSILFYAF